jgi:hypothetical protein
MGVAAEPLRAVVGVPDATPGGDDFFILLIPHCLVNVNYNQDIDNIPFSSLLIPHSSFVSKFYRYSLTACFLAGKEEISYQHCLTK